jgi:alpha-ketoglutarate-dependent 2,4-dichlorophenoxyacetate dioxygenase
MAINVRQIHPVFVGEVTGVDLSRPLEPAVRAEIEAAIFRHAVLVFPGQTISDEQQLGFSGWFGPLETSVRKLRPGNKDRLDPHIADISNLTEKHELMQRDDRRRMGQLANQLWHTDSSFKKVPARYSLLSARVVPPEGGETEFVDLRAAYDSLPAKLKAQIEDLVAEHWYLYSRGLIGFGDFSPEERAGLAPVQQVLVRVHPGSRRKTLYLASHAEHIIGMPVPEGRLLLRELTEYATQPNLIYRHRWTVGDLVMWDDRCTMHRGRPWDPQHVRDMHRTTVSDELSTLEQRERAPAHAQPAHAQPAHA